MRRLSSGVRGLIMVAAPALVLAVLPMGSANAADPDPPPPPDTLTRAGYILANGNRGDINLVAADPSPDSPAKVPGTKDIVVSLGDSYISGEAGRWAGNSLLVKWFSYSDQGGPNAYSDYNGAEALPQCHRSTHAEINIPGNDVDSVNLACSGATTKTAADSKPFKPGIDFTDTTLTGGARALGQALLLQNLAASNPGRVKMVVLSIGGNDFKFGKIVETCLQAFLTPFGDPCTKDTNITDLVSEKNALARQADIYGAIQRVVTAMDNAKYPRGSWTLVVQTYPSPIADSKTIMYDESYFRQLIGGCGLYNVDLDWANYTALRVINNTVAAAVAQARTKANPGDPEPPAIELLELDDALMGHRLCEKNTNLVGPLAWYPITGYVYSPVKTWKQDNAADLSEWTAEIRVGTKVKPEDFRPYDISESLHPNYWGQMAIGNCIVQAWNKGKVQGGLCVYGGTGLETDPTVKDRPKMLLLQPPTQQELVAAAPGKVRALGADPKRTGVVTVSWKKPSKGKVRGYSYRTRVGDKAWSTWRTNGMSRSVLLSVLRPNRTYTIAVRAENPGGTGPVAKKKFEVPR